MLKSGFFSVQNRLLPTIVVSFCFLLPLQTSYAHNENETEGFQEGIVSVEQYHTFNTPRFTLFIGEREENEDTQLHHSKQIATQSLKVLNDTFDELSRILNFLPERKVVLRFLSPKQFTEQTNAPEWTNAMFFRGEIIIPLNENLSMDAEELKRALRHEYVHAVFAEISGFRCPAWLDEGIAQLFEGQPNALLGPSLKRWIQKHEAMPLDWLENGFTSLDDSVVPAAYAQSLFVSRILVERHGFSGIVKYLTNLKDGHSGETAFKMAFGESQKDFEQSLTRKIALWAGSGQNTP